MTEAAEITRRAKSNLAFALAVLPKGRRADAVTYYAFCRTLDDLADAPGMVVEDRAKRLAAWRTGLHRGFENPDVLQCEVESMRDRHHIPREWLAALADGCMEDLEPKHYATWDELDAYIWKVAGAVGLVSARLFGCVDSGSDAYAEVLGRALQLTNILRDVGEDFANGGRIYLPREEWESSGLTGQDFSNQVGDQRFTDMMTRVADRAEQCFRDAESLLPEADRKALLPARIMAAIYQDLLQRMRADGFRVFLTRYRVPRWRKLWILVKLRMFG